MCTVHEQVMKNACFFRAKGRPMVVRHDLLHRKERSERTLPSLAEKRRATSTGTSIPTGSSGCGVRKYVPERKPSSKQIIYALMPKASAASSCLTTFPAVVDATHRIVDPAVPCCPKNASQAPRRKFCTTNYCSKCSPRRRRAVQSVLVSRTNAGKVWNANDAFDLNETILNRGSPKWFKALEKLHRIVEKERVPKRKPGESNADRRVFVPLELTPPMLAEVSAVLQPESAGEVLSSGFRLNITRSDMGTHNNGNWLNDEVINFYLNLIMERSATEKSSENGWPRVYAFNTFFYPKLAASGYTAVKRWTRSVDLFSFDILLVPLHCTLHWCLAAVDFRKRSIGYYDSLVSKGDKWQYLFHLQDHLGDESQGKKATTTEGDDWTLGNAEDLPKQENTSDRGVFMCQYSECLSRDAPVAFGQQHMPYFRKCMVYEILHKALLSA